MGLGLGSTVAQDATVSFSCPKSQILSLKKKFMDAQLFDLTAYITQTLSLSVVETNIGVR